MRRFIRIKAVCKEVIRKLSDYLDHELEPALAAELTRHLEHCKGCRIIVDTTRKTIEIYCNTEPASLPDKVRDRLNRALAEKLRKKSEPV